MNLDSQHSKARAKINLTLHVGRARQDGYHPLQSLVVFADIGDDIRLDTDTRSPHFSLNVSGPFGAGLSSGTDNLIYKAFDLYGSGNIDDMTASFTLVKNLPIASGIGGGSADAAAALRLLNNNVQFSHNNLIKIAQKIGADVPVCIGSNTCLMEGVGETLTPLQNLGQVAAILVNPSVSVSTATVFKQFDEDGKSTAFQSHADFRKSDDLIELARAGRNDLQESALKIEPIIQNVLDVTSAQEGCELARMSGSGATCFGLFTDVSRADKAQQSIAKQHPNWWCVSTLLGDRPLDNKSDASNKGAAS